VARGIDFPEKDWQYLRSVYGAMLDELSSRINDETRKVLEQSDLSEKDKRQRVFEVVNRGNGVVAECFDDWRRSTIIERCCALDKHRLLKPEHVAMLDPKTREWIRPTDVWRDRR
jgi:hypothetical protein